MRRQDTGLQTGGPREVWSKGGKGELAAESALHNSCLNPLGSLGARHLLLRVWVDL